MLMPVMVRAAVVCDHINMQVAYIWSPRVLFVLRYANYAHWYFLKTSVVACADKS
jgi:hypothetical protein